MVTQVVEFLQRNAQDVTVYEGALMGACLFLYLGVFVHVIGRRKR